MANPADRLVLPDHVQAERQAQRQAQAEYAIVVGMGAMPMTMCPATDKLDVASALRLTFVTPDGMEPVKDIVLVMVDSAWDDFSKMMDVAVNHARKTARDANRQRRTGHTNTPATPGTGSLPPGGTRQ